MMMRDRAALHAVKVVHTFVWALLASCVLAIPVTAWFGRLGAAFVLTAVVSAEVLVLAANQMRCPLTDVAARYTSDRSDNFDIYLPRWLARYNKVISVRCLSPVCFCSWRVGVAG